MYYVISDKELEELKDRNTLIIDVEGIHFAGTHIAWEDVESIWDPKPKNTPLGVASGTVIHVRPAVFLRMSIDLPLEVEGA